MKPKTNITSLPIRESKNDRSVVSSLSPREIVSELDRYVIGQKAAKRAVAIALRNRWRRQALKGAMKDEVLPKNILMIGPTGVGKTWLSLAIALIAAGGGKLELLDWVNDLPQPVFYIDGEMLEEDINERIKLLIPSLDLDEEELRKNFRFISRVSQPDDVEEFLSLELEKNQWELLNWVRDNTENGSHPSCTR